MNSPNLAGLEDKTFLLLVVAVSLAFAWILWPFYGAVFWGTVLAILFAPPYRRLLRFMGQRRTLAALATVMIVLMIVILPLTLIAALLLQEGFSVYERIQSGELNIGQYFQQVFGALPAWVTDLLDRFGLTNLGLMQERLSTGLMKGSQFLAAQALSIGQNTFHLIVNLFIVLYLLFFLLRDGDDLTKRIRNAMPLHAEQQRELLNRFTTVIRATVKGNVVVAIVQGALGGLIFWFLGVHAPVLWAVLMAFLSLLPGRERLDLAAGRHLFFSDRCDMAGRRSDRVQRARHRPGRQHPASDPGRQGYQDARLRRPDLHLGRHGDFRSQRLCDRASGRGDVYSCVGYCRFIKGGSAQGLKREVLAT